jgi:hypothetical protein
MPQFIPPSPNNFHGRAEETVYHILKGFKGNWTIYHSYHWRQTHDRWNKDEGETDFLLLSPEYGLIAIEVKGGIIELEQGSQKFHQHSGNKTRVLGESPMDQVNRSVYYLRHRISKFLKGEFFPVQGIIWLPDMKITQSEFPLPPDIIESAILTHEENDSEKAQEKIMRFIEAHSMSARLNSQDSIRNIRKAIEGSWNLVPASSPKSLDREEVFFRLTKNQAKVLEFIEGEDRVAISGMAGTGKTVILLELGRRLIAKGRKVLVLVFNDLLRSYLRTTNIPQDLKIENFHSLARSLHPELIQSSDADVPHLFCEILMESGEAFPYDDILIDEAQDFENFWLECLDEVVTGSIISFYDETQLIHHNSKDQKKLPSFISNSPIKLILRKNCRNTYQIARTANALKGIDYPMPKDPVHGPHPLWIYTNTKAEVIPCLTKTIHDFLKKGYGLNEIVILAYSTIESSELKDLTILNLPNKTSVRISIDPAQNNCIFVSTIRKFKGLESKIIIILGMNQRDFFSELQISLLYTGITRAREEVVLISNPPLLQPIQRIKFIETKGIEEEVKTSLTPEEFRTSLENEFFMKVQNFSL